MNLRTLSIRQAVAETGIPRDTLYKLCETGQVHANRPSPKGRWRISAASLQAWIERSAPAPVGTSDDDFRTRFPEAGSERVFG